MLKRSYSCFLKERLYLTILIVSTWAIFYCLTRSYGLAKPAMMNMSVAITLAVMAIVFIFGGALYQFLTQE